MAGEDLALGASSTVAPQAPAQSQQPNQQAAMLQVLQRMIQSRGQQAPLEGGLVNFGSQVNQPQAPVRMGTPDIKYPNKPGGYGTVGERKRDEKASLFHGIASSVRTAADYLQDKQIREMSMTTTRLMEATQGYEAAKQSGDQAAAKKNADIMNDILGDPKQVKKLQKAFNINLLGEGKDKDSPEYKGFIDAFKKFKSGESDLNPAAQKFVQSQPQVPQLSPQAQAQAAAVKAKVLPTADTQVRAGVDQEKNMVDVMKIIGTSGDKELAGERLEKVAKMRADTADKRMQNQIIQQVLKNYGSEAVAKVRNQGAAYVANKHYEGIETNQKYNMLRDLQKDWTKRDLASDPNLKAMDSVVKNYDREVKNLNDQLKVAEKAGDTPRIELLTKQMEAAKNVQDRVVAAYEKNIGPLEDVTDSKEDEQLSPEEQSVFEELFKDDN